MLSGLLSRLTRLAWLPGLLSRLARLLPRLPRLPRLLPWLTRLLSRLARLGFGISGLLRGGRIQLLIERIERARHRLLLRGRSGCRSLLSCGLR